MSAENLIYLFKINHDIVRENLRELTPQDLAWNPQPAGNNISWIFGHILESRNTILNMVGEPPVLTDDEALAFKPFIENVDRTKLLPVERLWEAWDASQTRLMDRLQAVEPEYLAELLPPWSEKGKPQQREQRLMFMYMHEVYHIGQFGILRRILGKEGAIG